MSFQYCLHVDMALSQRCFNVASMLVKAISKPIWLKKSMDLQKIDKFYSNKWENILYNILTINKSLTQFKALNASDTEA